MTHKIKETMMDENKILTIPNILSLIRIGIIPVIVYYYLGVRNSAMAGYLLILSGFTDVVDGFIARTFHMISNVGKVLDPFADKLTQAVILVCLMIHYPWMGLPLILMIIKEIYMTISGYMVVRKKGVVLGANWHGKAATLLLYGTMFLHIFWEEIPQGISSLAIMASTGMILLSFVLYALRNTRILKGNNCV